MSDFEPLGSFTCSSLHRPPLSLGSTLSPALTPRSCVCVSARGNQPMRAGLTASPVGHSSSLLHLAVLARLPAVCKTIQRLIGSKQQLEGRDQ